MHFKPASVSRAGPSFWGGEGLADPGFCGDRPECKCELQALLVGKYPREHGAGQAWGQGRHGTAGPDCCREHSSVLPAAL